MGQPLFAPQTHHSCSDFVNRNNFFSHLAAAGVASPPRCLRPENITEEGFDEGKRCSVIAMVATVAALTTLSRAQLLTGTVSTVGGSSSCPVYNSQNQADGLDSWHLLCQNATITGCSGADDINFTLLAMSRRHRAHTRGTVSVFQQCRRGSRPATMISNP